MPSEQEMNTILTTYGVNPSSLGFSWAALIGWLIYGVIGWSAFSYGRKEKNYRVLAIGLALMVFPYFVSNTILMYIVGAGISSLLYFWRD